MLSLLTSAVSPVLFIGIATHSEWQHKLKVQAIRSNRLSRMGGKALLCMSHLPVKICVIAGLHSWCLCQPFQLATFPTVLINFCNSIHVSICNHSKLYFSSAACWSTMNRLSCLSVGLHNQVIMNAWLNCPILPNHHQSQSPSPPSSASNSSILSSSVGLGITLPSTTSDNYSNQPLSGPSSKFSPCQDNSHM